MNIEELKEQLPLNPELPVVELTRGHSYLIVMDQRIGEEVYARISEHVKRLSDEMGIKVAIWAGGPIKIYELEGGRK